jgi:hypothetical protein
MEDLFRSKEDVMQVDMQEDTLKTTKDNTGQYLVVNKE